MKTLNSWMSVLFLISSSTAYAGDMYLVCENEKNDDFLSATIEKGRASMRLDLENNHPVLLTLKKLKSTQVSRYSLKIQFINEGFTDQVELKHFQEINIGSYTCLVRD